MSELGMTALLSDPYPAIGLDHPDQLSAILIAHDRFDNVYIHTHYSILSSAVIRQNT